ncbi:hypothetical protein Scep_030673 [Stephania cephalantha]|uniref:Autophagy-related protein 18a n=1 Tax=Stephania cephalantha TaxID=152367 RepID=A0AAP0E3H7_9MAGN
MVASKAVQSSVQKRLDDAESSAATLNLSSQNPNPNPSDDQSDSPPNLLHLSFNQDHGCFSAGTDRGFRIYNCDPFREVFRRVFDQGGGLGIVEMVFRWNIFAVVGGGSDPQYPPQKVLIWDDQQSRCTGELSFRSEVRAVRLRRDRIVVVLDQKVYVYDFKNFKVIRQIETSENSKGLCEVSQAAESFVLVCPGLLKGQVRVDDYSLRKTKFILAHGSSIACFALTQDGKVLATASIKGTLVRIFNTSDGNLLQEVRRGADRAEIYSLAFSPKAQWLAVSSDKGTVHVFSLQVNSGSAGNDKPHNAVSDANHVLPRTRSSLSFIKGVLPKYFSSQWSVAQFRLHEGSQHIVAFGHQKNTVVILGMDGRGRSDLDETAEFEDYDPHFSENGGGAASGGADLKRLPRGQAEDEDDELSEISSSSHLQITPINNNTTKMMTIGEISSTISRTRTTITISFPLTALTDSTIYRLMDSSVVKTLAEEPMTPPEISIPSIALVSSQM